MRRLLTQILLLAAGLSACSDSITGPAAAEASSEFSQDGESADAAAIQLTVMTRNLDVGTDVDRAITTPDPNDIPFVVGELWELLLANDAAGRMHAVAEEIAAERPHVVGLQEVSLFRTQTPADFQLNATDVEIDFLATLMDELAALGADYQVAALVEDTDVEIPRLNPDFSLTDVRLTDFDVILVRSDVPVLGSSSANYQAAVPGPLGIQILRGWTAVDIALGDERFHVVNTHLEPVETAGGFFQSLQAEELVALLAGESAPTVLMGDLNTEAGTGDTYASLMQEGFVDAWNLRAGVVDPGHTCCHATDLSSNDLSLVKRIDHVLLRNFETLWPASGPTPVRAEILGDDASEKTASGLWPSDHAGMVVRSILANPGSSFGFAVRSGGIR